MRTKAGPGGRYAVIWLLSIKPWPVSGLRPTAKPLASNRPPTCGWTSIISSSSWPRYERTITRPTKSVPFASLCLAKLLSYIATIFWPASPCGMPLSLTSGSSSRLSNCARPSPGPWSNWCVGIAWPEITKLPSATPGAGWLSIYYKSQYTAI